MSKTVRNLLILLVVQLLIVFAFSMKQDNLVSFAPNEPLAKIQAAEVTKLEVEQGVPSETASSESSEPKKLTLIKDGGTWKLAESENFPAAPTKVQSTIDKLAALKKSFPVATSEIAARQLKASSTEFEKKLIVSQGDKTQTFYLGTSPTFKKVHLRVDGDSNTYAVDFTSYDLSTSTGDWLNKSFFSIARDKIRKIKSGDLELKLDNNNPQMEGIEEKGELDIEKANSFLSKISSIEFTDMATTEQKKKIQDKKASFELSVEKTDNTIDTFQFIEGESADDVFLKLTSQPYFVKIAKSTVDDLKKVTKASLIKTKKTGDSAKSDASVVTSPTASGAPSMEPLPTPEGVADTEDGGMTMMSEMPPPEDGESEVIDLPDDSGSPQSESSELPNQQ